MREIKFRAWDKKTKRMFIIFDSEEQEEWYLPTCRDNYVVMQYTGLKDKSGTEIYEGDSIKHNGNMISVIQYVEEDAGFKLCNKRLGKMHISKEYFSKYTEVIGNIFDNPELLFKIKGE